MKWLVLVCFIIGAVERANYVNGSICNEAICASVVSKCMLTQSCKCDYLSTHCSCCKDCYSCLSYLYEQCCSCVGKSNMCPGITEARSPIINRQSFLEEIQDAIPPLFVALTSTPDPKKNWKSVSIPITVSDLSLHSVEQDMSKENTLTTNCTVAYMSQCMSWNKCKANCETMGSSSFRWFQDGCCECIGESCKKHGIDESRCLYCGISAVNKDEDKEDDLSVDDLDYGEDADPQDADSFS